MVESVEYQHRNPGWVVRVGLDRAAVDGAVVPLAWPVGQKKCPDCPGETVEQDPELAIVSDDVEVPQAGDSRPCQGAVTARCVTADSRPVRDNAEHRPGQGRQHLGYTRSMGRARRSVRTRPGAARRLRPQSRWSTTCPDERLLYLSDILPTVWREVRYAYTPEGGTLAVIVAEFRIAGPRAKPGSAGPHPRVTLRP